MRKLFDFKTKKVLDEIEKKESKITAEIQAISDRGRSCLNMKEFTDYAAEYVVLERNLTNFLIDYTKKWQNYEISSIEKYGVKIMLLLSRLGDLRALIDKVNLDANRGDKNNG